MKSSQPTLRHRASPKLLKVIGQRNLNTRGLVKLLSAEAYLQEQRKGHVTIDQAMLDNASAILTLGGLRKALIETRRGLGVELWAEMDRLERKRA
jgi:hypothetical protein